MAQTVRIEEMSPAELQDALRRTPLIYVPCGLIEWHGQHLPLGLDGLKMYRILLGCAERTGGVVLPLNWLGAPGFGAFCGTLSYADDLVTQVLKAILGQCAKLGAKVIALVTGHYGPRQVNVVKRAGEEFMAENPGVLVLARPEYEGVTVDGESPADHGGKWETSMALALFPELVHMERFGMGEEPIHHYGEQYAEFDAERKPWTWTVDLHEAASAELGQRAVEAIRSVIVEDVRALLEKV